jgi:uncharacterized protein (TIGR03435 family)
MRTYFRIALLFSAASMFAQTPLTFEVASIKSAGTLDIGKMQAGKMPRIGMKVDGALCDIGSFTLKDLIRTAYEVKDYQIIAPDSIGNPMTSERFNIQATMPEGTTEKQVPQMLRALLADRFKLVVHTETKDHSVYALIVAKGGPKLKEAEPDPPASTDADPLPEPKKGEMVMGQGKDQVRVTGSMENGKGVTVKGGPMGQMRMSMADGRMHMEADKMSMAMMTETITRFVDRPVVDMTELKGNYHIALDLSMDDMKNAAKAAGMAAMMGPGEAARQSAEASEPSGSSIFMSMQQMGLKLEPRKAPMMVIVVDHLEKSPTEN